MVANDRTLARRLEDADANSNVVYAHTKAQMIPESDSAVETVGDGFAVFTGRSSPINRAFGMGMHGPVCEADLARVEEFFAEREVAAQVDVCPLADATLMRFLRTRSYRLLGFKNVLARRLNGLESLSSPAGYVTVTIVEKDDQAMSDLWAQVVSQSFSGLGTLAEANTDVSWPTSRKPDTTCFLAWIDNEPAGGGALATHEGVAICFSTSVQPALRRMGVQTALLHARLRYAQAAGCDLAMVQTIPGSDSQRNVERFEFRPAYTKVAMVLE